LANKWYLTPLKYTGLVFWYDAHNTENFIMRRPNDTQVSGWLCNIDFRNRMVRKDPTVNCDFPLLDSGGINGKNALYFNGFNLTGAYLINSTLPYPRFNMNCGVAKRGLQNVGVIIDTRPLVCWSDGSNNIYPMGTARIGTAGYDGFKCETVGQLAATPSGSWPLNTTRLLTSFIQGTSGFLAAHVNRSEWRGRSVYTTSSAPRVGLNIGGFPGASASAKFAGAIGELIEYGGSETGIIRDIENYLSMKWGVTRTGE
jgi:hypothetical protein